MAEAVLCYVLSLGTIGLGALALIAGVRWPVAATVHARMGGAFIATVGLFGLIACVLLH